MFKRILSSLANLYNLLAGSGSTSIDTKLDNIEKRLDRIEENIERQARFALFAVISAPGLGITAIGVALAPRAEYAALAVFLMVFGLCLPIAAGLGYIIKTHRR